MLENAANNGIIRHDQVEPLYLFAQSYQSGSTPIINSDATKFVRSIGDVFIMLGVVVLSLALGALSSGGFANAFIVLGLFVLSEWMVGKRKLVLPGMALVIAIMWFSRDIIHSGDHRVIMNLGTSVLASALFFLRHKMPFSIATTAVGLVIFLVALLPSGSEHILPYVTGGCGLLFFILALFFDAKDTARITRYSDTAFWLHLISAPLMTHSLLLPLIIGAQHSNGKMFVMSLFILSFFVLMTLLALFIDRRPILVSNLLYVIFATFKLFTNGGFPNPSTLGFIVLSFGMFVIVLGMGWYRIRTKIFSRFQSSAISKYVPSFSISS